MTNNLNRGGFWQRLVATIRFLIARIAKTILRFLDWGVMVMERLLVLGLAYLAFCFGYHLLRGDFGHGQLDALKSISENWKAGLLLLLILFYGTVRKFLEEVHEFAGMKRQQHGIPEGEDVIPGTK